MKQVKGPPCLKASLLHGLLCSHQWHLCHSDYFTMLSCCVESYTDEALSLWFVWISKSQQLWLHRDDVLPWNNVTAVCMGLDMTIEIITKISRKVCEKWKIMRSVRENRKDVESVTTLVLQIIWAFTSHLWRLWSPSKESGSSRLSAPLWISIQKSSGKMLYRTFRPYM